MTTPQAIVALFVDRRGPYWNRPGIDAWDEERDARKYVGHEPVVAHPPCERWGRYWGGGPSAKVKRVLDEGFHSKAERDAARASGQKPVKRLSTVQNIVTPPAFAELLISLARGVR